MLNKYLVPSFIVAEFPELEAELKKISATLNVYKCMACFVGFTKKQMITDNFAKLRQCFLTIEHLYINADEQVKTAIESVYIHALSATDKILGIHERKKMLPLMPAIIQNLYLEQRSSSGI
jgi:hypothetical protein